MKGRTVEKLETIAFWLIGAFAVLGVVGALALGSGR